MEAPSASASATPPHRGLTDPRRIAMFVHTLDDRAVSRLTLTVSEHLVEMGHEVVLIAATRAARSTRPVPPGLKIIELGLGKLPTAFGTLRLVPVFRRLRPDVVFAHLNGPARAAVVARALGRVPPSVVAVEHVHYPTFYLRRRWLRDRLTAALYPRADRVAGVAPGVVDDLAARFPGIRGRTVVLPTLGPDPERMPASFPPPDHPWFQGVERPRLVCTVANVVQRKGHDTLVEALAVVRRELGDVQLVIVGRFDDPAFLERLRRLVSELGLQEHVWLAGYRADALPFIANADVFVLASTTEGCPTVLVEAMACGVPVVSTDCPVGPAFVVDGGRCGVLVPVGDAGALAKGIIETLRDPGLRAELIARGRERVIRFSPRQVAEDYATLAQQCWQERQGHASR